MNNFKHLKKLEPTGMPDWDDFISQYWRRRIRESEQAGWGLVEYFCLALFLACLFLAFMIDLFGAK